MSVSGLGGLFGSATSVASAKPVTGGGLTAAPAKTPEEEFLDYAKMTPAQKMRASILSSMGLKEEDLQAMDPKARKLVEDKIKQMIKDQITNDPNMRKGSFLDVKA